jgi:glycosyltransferase involved in cell wall biosynthesis
MKDVVFIAGTTKQPRVIRRIKDFIDHGYNVHVFAFEREGDKRQLSDLKMTVLGSIESGNGYISRLKYVRSTIKKEVLPLFKGRNVLFYMFGFDMASACSSLFKKGSYIFELADLQELNYSGIVRKILVAWNRRIMNRSFETVLTSEGFKDFYFGEKPVSNISVLPNKLNKAVRDLEFPHKELDINHIKIGFTGAIRFFTVLRFTQVVDKYFPNIELHFYGQCNDLDIKKDIEELFDKSKNVFFHGVFKNPDDLPNIYSKVDMILALYPADKMGVVYAEPNKLYEAIYYEKPIIVSEKIFLGNKVSRLNVGFAIDGLSEESIKVFLSSLTKESLEDKIASCKKIEKNYSIDDSSAFFKKIAKKLPLIAAS